MVDLNKLKTENAIRWANAKLTRNFIAEARRLTDPPAKKRYQDVSTKTGVPWAIIAVIHEREADQNWHTQLGQGDPLSQVSTHIPKGRGPFQSWEDGAFDALVNCPPHAARWTDWTIGGSLTLLEQYNGLGYFERGYPSPYIWSGTNQYTSGKYVRDGVFDPHVVDSQPGCAGLLKTMMFYDHSITFGIPSPMVAIPSASATIGHPTMPVSLPTTHEVAPQAKKPDNALKRFLAMIMALFRRKQ